MIAGEGCKMSVVQMYSQGALKESEHSKMQFPASGHSQFGFSFFPIPFIND